MGSDLIGFHTYDYCRHFIKSTSKILGFNTINENFIRYNDRKVTYKIFPIGIDPLKFEIDLIPEAQKRIMELKSKYEGYQIILGIDRLDYIKGIPNKLHAFEMVLEKQTTNTRKVILIQIAIPSRIEVDEYISLKLKVEGIVGRINGKFGMSNNVNIQ